MGLCPLGPEAAAVEKVVYEDDDDDEGEEPMTAFALAYQRALGQPDEDESEAELGEDTNATTRERERQEEILARTLAEHKDRE